MNFSQVVFQKSRILESAAADMAGDYPAGAGAVHKVVVPLGTAETGKSLGTGQTLPANTVRQPGHSHVVHRDVH